MREAIRDCLTLLESGYEAEWEGYFPRYDSRLQTLRQKVLEREGAQGTAVCQTKPVDELNVEELLAHLAWIFLAERMSAGFLDTQIRSGELEKLLRRYLDLTEVEG